MASEKPQTVIAPPHVVGNAFVQQYYHILHQSPELVHRFYQDSSKLSRPDSEGAMSTITTTQAIDAKILSMEFKDYRAEIKTVDAQESINGGVLVLVTGYLTGKDNIKRNFTQNFFLAPQEIGYFVLNDMFRYVEPSDEEHHGTQISDKEPYESPVQEHDVPKHEEDVVVTVSPPVVEEEESKIEEVYDSKSNWDEVVVQEVAPVSETVDEVPNGSEIPVDSGSAASLEEAPKKSYASIVKVMRENASSLSSSSSSTTSSAKPPPVIPEWQPAPVPTSSPPKPEPLSSVSNAPVTGNVQEAEADGHAIYVKSLPLNATEAQLEEEFKRFGPIKPGGIQVRSNKQQGFCFGFVEFEATSAVQSAIEASPVTIGGRQVYVEEKRPSGSRGETRRQKTSDQDADVASSDLLTVGGRGLQHSCYNPNLLFRRLLGRGSGKGVYDTVVVICHLTDSDRLLCIDPPAHTPLHPYLGPRALFPRSRIYVEPSPLLRYPPH